MTRVVDYTIIDRMVRAVEKVLEPLLRSTGILQTANLPYAVAGGNAVGAWVARMDEAAVRNTQDVDIMLRRSDLPAATVALEANGFHYRHTAGLDLFLDGANGKPREAVHIIFANEKVRPTEPVANPDVLDSEWMGSFQALSLPALVQIRLTAFRDNNRTHLRDMIDVGLIDQTWTAKFPKQLGDRLQSLLDSPGR